MPHITADRPPTHPGTYRVVHHTPGTAPTADPPTSYDQAMAAFTKEVAGGACSVRLAVQSDYEWQRTVAVWARGALAS